MPATRDDAPSPPSEPDEGVRTVGGGQPIGRVRRADRPRAPRPVAAAASSSPAPADSTRPSGRLGRPIGAGGPARPARPLALVVVAILGVAGTVGFGLAWRQARSHARSVAAQGSAATDMHDAAQRFSVALTTFDGATIDRDVARLNDFGTGQFGDQLSQFFSTRIRTELKAAQASSRGDVRSVFVESFDGQRGRAFAVVDQTIANNKFPQPQADTLRLDIGLEKVGGTWKVFDLQTVGAGVGATTSGSAATPTSRP